MNKIFLIAIVISSMILMSSCSDSTEPEKIPDIPTFSPPAMIYTSPQLITITSNLEDSIIRYTIDGKNPNSESPEFIDPIHITTTTIIKARVFKEGWSMSNIASAKYVIPEMIHVPGGNFTMGDTKGEGYDDEKPVSEVTLSSFYIGKYPVTQIEWVETMENNPSNNNDKLDYPVEEINWYATLVYCNRKSQASGFVPVYSINNSTNPDDWGAIPESNNSEWNEVAANWQANGYRLATEAEWEYAARGGSSSPDYLYAGSNNSDIVAWHSGNSNGSSQPVGEKLPNGLGIYDMSGNVYEWVWDWRADYNAQPKTDPRGPETGTMRVERGGSWTQLPVRARVSNRNHSFPRHGNHHRGFRVVRGS